MIAARRLVVSGHRCRNFYYALGGASSGSAVIPEYNRRSYHVTGRDENALIVGGLTVAVSAVGLQYALQWYNNRPKTTEPEHTENIDSPDDSTKKTTGRKAAPGAGKTTDAKTEGPQPFYASWFEKKFYEGGFEDKMTKREAALILGITI